MDAHLRLSVTRFVRCEHDGELKAFCDVAIGEHLLVKGVRVVQGRKGPFVSMPRQCSKSGKWYDSVILRTKEARMALARTVLDAYGGHDDGHEP